MDNNIIEKEKCHYCGDSESKLLATFGKKVCIKCRDERKTGRKGHSGMIYDKDVDIDFYQDMFNSGLSLLKLKKVIHCFANGFLNITQAVRVL